MIGPLRVVVSVFRSTFRIEGRGPHHHVEEARRWCSCRRAGEASLHYFFHFWPLVQTLGVDRLLGLLGFLRAPIPHKGSDSTTSTTRNEQHSSRRRSFGLLIIIMIMLKILMLLSCEPFMLCVYHTTSTQNDSVGTLRSGARNNLAPSPGQLQNLKLTIGAKVRKKHRQNTFCS